MKNMNAFYEASREALSKNNPQIFNPRRMDEEGRLILRIDENKVERELASIFDGDRPEYLKEFCLQTLEFVEALEVNKRYYDFFLSDKEDTDELTDEDRTFISEMIETIGVTQASLKSFLDKWANPWANVPDVEEQRRYLDEFLKKQAN